MSFYFFGTEYSKPGAYAVIDYSGMAKRATPSGKVLAIVGPSDAGLQNVDENLFTSEAEAKKYLLGGDLFEHVRKAFSPAPGVSGPSRIYAIPANVNVPAAIALKDAGSVAVLNGATRMAGRAANQWKLKLQSATGGKGYKPTVAYQDRQWAADDVCEDLLTIRYTGAGTTCTLTITAAALTLTCADVPADSLSVSLVDFPTIQTLVDAIAAHPLFVVEVKTQDPLNRLSKDLDEVADQNVKDGTYTCGGHVSALFRWLNSIRDLTWDRVSGKPLAVIADFTYFTGGATGVASAESWAEALGKLQTINATHVMVTSNEASIHAAVDAHVVYCSRIDIHRPRRAIVGGAAGETYVQVKARRLALNSPRTTLCWPGIQSYDSKGLLRTFGPSMTAAAVAGLICSLDIGVPATFKMITAQGLETIPAVPECTGADGITVIELVQEQGASGYRVVHCVSTWGGTPNYIDNEPCVSEEVDAVQELARIRLQQRFAGTRGKGPTSLPEAEGVVKGALADSEGYGWLVGDKNNPAYTDIVARMDGDSLIVDYGYMVALPINYIGLVGHPTYYRGSVSV